MPILSKLSQFVLSEEKFWSFKLFLDDAGADMIADDGVYSGYFLNFTGNGRYGLSVSIKWSVCEQSEGIRHTDD